MIRRLRQARHNGMNPFAAGLIALAIVAVGTYFGFTKANPFSEPFELQAVFETANNLQTRSPVRIAGVDVGEVTEVEPVGENGAARATMEIKDNGLPIHEDAEMTIRPRIFLEGNYFVDLEPGSPSAPEIGEGAVIPSNQTASPVQLGQLLSVLESDVREDLQTLLDQYSKGLEGEGARGFNESIKYWERAYRASALANDATLGIEEGDFSRLMEGQAKTFEALARNERALKDLVSEFNVTAAAFAREDEALQAAIPELRDVLDVGMPALASLNDSLPSVRAFARDALPGTKSSLPTINASLPFIEQARKLVSDNELKGLAADLRPTVPALTRLNRGSVPLFEQQALLSSCQNEVLLPFSTTPIPDPDFETIDGEPFFMGGPRGLVGLAGESRLHDANSPIQRAAFNAGPQEIGNVTDDGERVFGTAMLPLFGARPARPNERPDFRPDVPCETQEPPNLNAPAGRAEQNIEADPVLDPESRARRAKAQEELDKVLQHLRDKAKGRPTIDPLRYSEKGLVYQAGLRELVPLENGRFREMTTKEERAFGRKFRDFIGEKGGEK